MTDLKPGWQRVKFGEVVRQVKDKVNPTTSGLERFVAGEHMDTDELRIRRWGDVGDGYLGPAFHMRFKPGQVLYGSRRTYLRKVAVADFEGICANTTFILEPVNPNELLPELLPFIMSTEAFHEHSRRESKGSVNPYVNFSDLAWFEFALPPLEEQRRIAKLLVAAFDHLDSLGQLAMRAEQAQQASIVDLLMLRGFQPSNGRAPYLPSNWVVRKGQDVLIAESGNGEPICDANANHLFFKVADFNRNEDEQKLAVTESRFALETIQENRRIRLFTEGTIIFPKRGASIFLNKVGVLTKKAALDPNLMAITSKDPGLRQRYLFWFAKGVGLWRLAETTSVPQLNHKHLYAAHFLLPPVAVQDRLCDELEKMRLATLRIRDQISSARTRASALMNECDL